VGDYTGSASPNATFDQGGNVWEWTETIITSSRGIRGGAFFNSPNDLAASWGPGGFQTSGEGEYLGFRVASLPEPTQALLYTCALATLALLRRRARSG